MKPPYTITAKILHQISSISEQIGEIKAHFLNKPSPQLRKKNRVKTIQASLEIEGNTLSIEQTTAVMDNKRVLGPAKDILEVTNAIRTYDLLEQTDYRSEKDFLNSHALLMNGLVPDCGKYRSGGVGIFQGEKVIHAAPSAKRVPLLMRDLFNYLKSDEHVLIKSCVFHYEMEFIHPFMDGNGRMGRLWQTLILSKHYSVFEYLPFETLIGQSQEKYYEALSRSDLAGESTIFIEYMLRIIEEALNELLKSSNHILSEEDRLKYYLQFGEAVFSRKDYMRVFKNISSATASRDLKLGVLKGYFKKNGEKNSTVYTVINK